MEVETVGAADEGGDAGGDGASGAGGAVGGSLFGVAVLVSVRERNSLEPLNLRLSRDADKI